MPRALITGAASLIGAAIARKLGRQGWDLVLADIDILELEKVAGELGRVARHEIHRMDVTDHNEVSKVVGAAAKTGDLDGLVNCAGGLRGLGVQRAPLERITPEDWRKVVDTNLKGVLNVVHQVLPVMGRKKSGSIVSVAASRGVRGGPGAAHYSAAKAGIILFTQTMVLECADNGVRINSIAPGNTEARWKTSEMTGTIGPLGRMTSPDDIANVTAFLLSEEGAHITGACVDLSGGTTLH